VGEDISSCFPASKFTKIKHQELNPCLTEASFCGIMLIYTCPRANPLNPARKLFQISEKNKTNNAYLL